MSPSPIRARTVKKKERPEPDPKGLSVSGPIGSRQACRVIAGRGRDNVRHKRILARITSADVVQTQGSMSAGDCPLLIDGFIHGF